MGVIVEPFVYVLAFLVDIYFKVVVVEVVLHWLIHFKILEADNKYAKKTMEILEQLTAPVYAKISAKMPKLAGIDVSPFVLLLGLMVVSRILHNLGELFM